MKEYDATEIAVKNGYKKGVQEMVALLNDRINDKLDYHGWYVKEVVISEIAKELSEGVKCD